jgi:hypothetical protein
MMRVKRTFDRAPARIGASAPRARPQSRAAPWATCRFARRAGFGRGEELIRTGKPASGVPWLSRGARPGFAGKPPAALMCAVLGDGANVRPCPRANRRPCTQGSPAKPGSALGHLPVRPQSGLRKGRARISTRDRQPLRRPCARSVASGGRVETPQPRRSTSIAARVGVPRRQNGRFVGLTTMLSRPSTSRSAISTAS